MSKSYSPQGYAPPETRNLKYSPKCHFYLNGDKFFSGRKFCISNQYKTFDIVKDELGKRVLKDNSRNGFIRNIFTPVGGTRVDHLDEFKDGEHYVVSLSDKFQPLPYREIPENSRGRYPRRTKGFKKIDIDRIYTPVQHANSEQYRRKSGRSHTLSKNCKGMVLRVHVNREICAVHPIGILPVQMNDMTQIMIEFERRLQIRQIRRVFKIDNEGHRGPTDFTEVHGADELHPGDHLLVVPEGDKRIDFRYYPVLGMKDITVKTSPRSDFIGKQNYYLKGDKDRYRHNKSLNKHDPLPSIGSSKQSDSRSPFSNTGSQGRRRNNQKSRTKQVDYDKDHNSGVYHAKKQNNGRGAQQVNDTRDTRTEKPIDQMEAEIVEEEEINTKEKTTPIPPGTELNKQPSKETKQNADSQTKKSSQVKKDNKNDKKNNVSVLPPIISDNEQTADSIKNKESDKKDNKVVKDGQVKEAVKNIENNSDTKNTNGKTGDKVVDQKSGTDMEVEQIQGTVTPSGTKSNKTDAVKNQGTVTPSGTKPNKTEPGKSQGTVTPSGTQTKAEPNKTPLPASPIDGKISQASQTTKERVNEDAGMHHNDDFDDDSFNQHGYDSNTPGVQNRDNRDMRSSTPASRGESRRMQQQKENEAAVKIQAGARGYKTRKEFKAKKESMQREKDERNRQQREKEDDYRRREADQQQNTQQKGRDEDYAASKIQASFKGYKTRKDLKTKQQVSHSNINDTKNMSESDAAVKIQSGFKGYQTRKEYKYKKAQKQAEHEKQKATDINDNEEKDKYKAENEAATKIQSNFRGYKTRKEIASKKSTDTSVDNKKMNEDHAAEKIQAGFKGYKTRKDLAMKKSDKERVKADNQSDEAKKQQHAATKIQSGFRGHKVRKDYNEKKQQNMVRKEEEAATRIQASFKGYNTRKQMSNKKKEQLPDPTPSPKPDNSADLDKAATKIQSGFRGYKTRKDFKSKVNAEPVVEADLDQLPDSAKTRIVKKDQFIPGSKGALASVIQSAYRVLHAKKTIETGGDAFKFGWGIEEPDTNSYDRLISNFKGFLVRKRHAYEKEECHRKSNAAVKIQSSYRGYRVRQTKHYSFRAVGSLQASVRGYITRKLNKVEVSETPVIFNVANGDYYASVIQALCKGFLIRHTVKGLPRNDRSKIKSASSVQGPSVNESSGESENEISYWQDTNIKMYSDKTLRKAAAKIQSAYYSYQTRLKFNRLQGVIGFKSNEDNELFMLNATSRVQSSFKGYIIRAHAKSARESESGVKREQSEEVDECEVKDSSNDSSYEKGMRKRTSNDSRASDSGIKSSSVDGIAVEKDTIDEVNTSELSANKLLKEDTLRSSTRLSDRTNSLKSEMKLNISDIEYETRKGSALTKTTSARTKTSGGEIEKEGESLREIEDEEGELSSMEKNVNAVGHLQAAFRAYKLRREISELMSGGEELIDIKQVDRAVSALRKDFSLRSAKVRRLGFGKVQEKEGGTAGQNWWENDDENDESLSDRDNDSDLSGMKTSRDDGEEDNAVIDVPTERKGDAKLIIQAAYRGFVSRMTERIIKSASKSRTSSRNSRKRMSSSKSVRSGFHVQMHSDIINDRSTRLQAAFAAYQTRKVFISLSKLVEEGERSGHSNGSTKLERMGSLSETDDFKLRSKSIAKIQAAYDSHKIANDVRQFLGTDAFAKPGSIKTPLSPTFINPHKVLPPIQHNGQSTRPKSGAPRSCLDIPIVPGEKSKTQPDLKKRYSKGLSNIEIYIQKKLAASVIQAYAKGYLTRRMLVARTTSKGYTPGEPKATPTADRKTPTSNSRKRPLSSTSSKGSSKSSTNKSCKDVKHREDKTDIMRVRTASIKLEAERRKVIAEQIRLKEQARAKEETLAINIKNEDNASAGKMGDKETAGHLSPIPSTRRLEVDNTADLKRQNEAAVQIQKVYRGHKTRRSIEQKQKLQHEYEVWKAKRDGAAVTIQSTWRGYHVRKELQKSPEVPESVVDFSHLDDQPGGLIVINIGRTKSEIERANLLYANVSMIQMVYRACEIRRKLALKFSKRRLERNKAASKIQAYYSGHMTRHKRKESASATRIQNVFKAYLSRDDMYGRQVAKAEDEFKAATLIQSSYKSFRRRRLNEAEKKVRKLNQAATELQLVVQCYIARREFRKKRNRIEYVSASKLQASFKGYKVRSNIERTRKAAIVIVAGFQGFQAREELRALINKLKEQKIAATRLQAAYKAYLARRSNQQHKEKVARQNKAATGIQCSFQGMKTRRKYVKDQQLLQEKRQRSALKIQSTYRGHLGRKVASEKRHVKEIHFIAVGTVEGVITRMWGYVTRRSQSSERIQSTVKGYQARRAMVMKMSDEEKLRNIHASFIQSTFRAYRHRVETEMKRRISRLKERTNNRASVIQSGFRAYKHRVEAEKTKQMCMLKEQTNRFASIVQLAYRTSRFKKEMEVKNKLRYDVASIIQAVYFAKEIRNRHSHTLQEDLRNHSAVKIQAIYRGYSTRKDIQKEKEMIAGLEPPPSGLISARTNSGRLLTISVDELLMKNSRAIIIFHKKATELQDAVRGYLTRKEMQERLERKSVVTQRTPRLASGVTYNAPKRVLSVTKRWTREERAAIMIQKIFRGYWNRNIYRNALKQRKRYLNDAATRIQSVVKGYIVRYSENGKRISMKDEAMNVMLRRRHEAADVIVCAFRSHQAREMKNDLRVEM